MERPRSIQLPSLTVSALIGALAALLFVARVASAAQINHVALRAVWCVQWPNTRHEQIDGAIANIPQVSLPVSDPITPPEVSLAMSCLYHTKKWTDLIQLGEARKPQDSTEAFFVGEAHRQMGHMEQALAHWRAFPQVASYFRWTCTDRLNAHNCAIALDACQIAVGIDPHYGEAYAELGRVYTYCTQRLNDAIDSYQQAADLGVDSEAMWLGYAHALNMQGHFVEAGQIADAHQLSGALADLIRGDALRQQNRLAEAIQLYHRSLAQSDRDPWLYHKLALTYQALGKNLEAVQAWQQALQLDPSFRPALEGISAISPKQR